MNWELAASHSELATFELAAIIAPVPVRLLDRAAVRQGGELGLGTGRAELADLLAIVELRAGSQRRNWELD